MDVQFSGAVDFSPLLNSMASPSVAVPSAKSGAAANSHANMLQAQNSLLAPLSGGAAAMAMSTELALNAGLGANINIWA